MASRRLAAPAYYAATQPYATRGWCVPWLTITLLGIFAGLFWLEFNLPGIPPATPLEPSRAAVIALGAASRGLVEAGQSWRMLTAPFLHGSLSHLIGNAGVFAFAGYQLERLLGRAWTFCIFAAGGLSGAAVSLLVLPPYVTTVGASGAIMAMLAALFLANFRLPSGRAKTRSQWVVAWFAIPALLPLNHGEAGMRIDYGAHAGGAMFGTLLGLLLLGIWDRYETLPPWRWLASVLAVAALAAYGGAAFAVSQSWQSPVAARIMTPAGMIPDNEIPRGMDEITARAITLLGQYPSDPRSHYFAAIAQFRRNDAGDAVAELRITLSLIDPPKQLLMPRLANNARGLLGAALLATGRREDAAAAAGPACHPALGEAPAPEISALLEKHELCR